MKSELAKHSPQTPNECLREAWCRKKEHPNLALPSFCLDVGDRAGQNGTCITICPCVHDNSLTASNPPHEGSFYFPFSSLDNVDLEY